MWNNLKEIAIRVRRDADRRKLQILKRAGGATALFFILMVTFDSTPFFAMAYIVSGIVFATLMCWEPYFDTLPKEVDINNGSVHVVDGFGFVIQYPMLTTTNDRYIFSFYYMPYNHLAWKLSRLKCMEDILFGRYRKHYIGVLGRALLGMRDTTAMLNKSMIDGRVDLLHSTNDHKTQSLAALISHMAVGLETMRSDPYDVKRFAVNYACAAVTRMRGLDNAQ